MVVSKRNSIRDEQRLQMQRNTVTGERNWALSRGYVTWSVVQSTMSKYRGFGRSFWKNLTLSSNRALYLTKLSEHSYGYHDEG
jgi:hypothetical protein